MKRGNKRVIFLPLFYWLPHGGISKQRADKANTITKGLLGLAARPRPSVSMGWGVSACPLSIRAPGQWDELTRSLYHTSAGK